MYSNSLVLLLLMSSSFLTSCSPSRSRNTNVLQPASPGQLKRVDDPLKGVKAVILSEKEGAIGNLISNVEGVEGGFSESDASGVVIQFRRNGKPAIVKNGSISAELFLPNKQKWPIRRFYLKDSLGVFWIPSGYDLAPKYMKLVLKSVISPNRELANVKVTKLAPAKTVIKPNEPKMAGSRWKIIPKENLGADLQLVGRPPNTWSKVEVLRTTHVDYRTQSPKAGGRKFFSPIKLEGDLLKTWTTFEAGMREIELEETMATRIDSTDTVIVKGIYLEEVYGNFVLSIPHNISVSTKHGNTFEIPKQRVAPFRAGQTKSRSIQFQAKYRFSKERLPRFYDYAKITTTIPPLGEFGIDALNISMDVYGRPENSTSQVTQRPYSGQKEKLSIDAVQTAKLGALPPINFVFDVQIWKKTGTYRGIISVPDWPKKVEH